MSQALGPIGAQIHHLSFLTPKVACKNTLLHREMLRSRRPATGSFGPFGPECPGECPRQCPRKRGCLTECRTGCFRAPSSGVSKKWPESVSGVSKKGVPDTPATLSGHFGHSGARRPKGPGDTPWDTLSDIPVFGDTVPESWSAGSQGKCLVLTRKTQ